MSQNRQIKKVKKYRTLKVVFYFLGLPLFILAVLLTSIRFIGHDPFVGGAELMGAFAMLTEHEAQITSPALFGIWLAFGVWLIISVVHLILSKTVKSRRVRMFSVLAVVLVIMLGGTLLMDTIFDIQIDRMREEHIELYGEDDGVVIEDYRTQLSYYRTVSSFAKAKGYTNKLIDQVNTLEKVYHVGYYGDNRSGVAGNISNKPATYGNVISDDGKEGVDISYTRNENNQLVIAMEEGDGNIHKGDGVINEVEDNRIIRLAPNPNGYLEINGEEYTKYFYCMRTLTTGEKIYVWYPLLLMPLSFDWNAKAGTGGSKAADGVYGEALYNESGLISDGWIFSIENVVEILEDYYEANEFLAQYEATNKSAYATIVNDATKIRDQYYAGQYEDPVTGELCDPWLQTHYQQQEEYRQRFSVTEEDLDFLFAQVGGLLGNNHLFDFLFSYWSDIVGESGIGGFLGGLGGALQPMLDNLGRGISIVDLVGMFSEQTEESKAQLKETLKTVFTYILPNEEEINDIYICFAYKNKNCFGEDCDHLYLAILNHTPNEQDTVDPSTGITKAHFLKDEVALDIDFTAAATDGDYAFQLDHLSTFLNDVLNGVLQLPVNGQPVLDMLNDGIINTILGLFLKDIPVTTESNQTLTYKGLEISGFKIPLFATNSDGKITGVDINVKSILVNILEKYYSYTSSGIKPIWEFYDWQEYNNEQATIAQQMYKQRERAEFEATIYGPMIGSALLGDNLGTGNYPSSFGLGSLAAVRQLKVDLSYKPVYYPLFGFRDMLITFSGIVMLFYFMSFVAAEKEEKYARGEILPKGSDLTDYELPPANPDEKVIIHEKASKGEELAPTEDDKAVKGKKPSGKAAPSKGKGGSKTPVKKTTKKGVK